MPTDWMLQQLLSHLINSAPWLIGLFGGLALINFGPLGKAFRARLQAPARSSDDPRLDTIMADVSQILERLDYLERLAVQDARHQQLPPRKQETTPV